MSEEDNKEELRPSKMRGVAFPKAKYGVIFAVIIIVSLLTSPPSEKIKTLVANIRYPELKSNN